VVPESTFSDNDQPEMKILSREQFQVIEEELHEEIREYGSADLNYKLLVKSGSAFTSIIETSIVEDIDLMVLGKKNDLKGSGIVPLELTRFAPTSILFVPEKHKCVLHDILVCNDFSKFSASAMNEALELASNNPEEISITSLHLFSHGEDTDIEIQQHQQELLTGRYNEFIKDFDLDNVHITPKFLNTDKSTISSVISRYANKKKTDLIITGSRGRPESNLFLIGSLTARPVQSKLSAPLLIVKPHLHDSVLKEELLRELQNT
jgi:nucleotide-binding universal stress UspA family protein